MDRRAQSRSSALRAVQAKGSVPVLPAWCSEARFVCDHSPGRIASVTQPNSPLRYAGKYDVSPELVLVASRS